MKKILALACSLTFLISGHAQKKTMDESVYSIWNRIGDTKISHNGDWVIYTLRPEDGDKTLKIYNTRQSKTYTFPCVKSPVINQSASHVIFYTVAPVDSIRSLKRKDTKKEDLPNDTLSLYSTINRELVKIPNVKSFKVPDKWDGYLFYLLEPQDEKPNSLKKTSKTENKKNGSKLIVRSLTDSREDTLGYVTDYGTAEDGEGLYAVSTGDSLLTSGIYIYDFSSHRFKNILAGEGKFPQVRWDEKGSQLAMVADLDTTESFARPYRLYYYDKFKDQAKLIANSKSRFMEKNWVISPHQALDFSEDGSKLLFGRFPQPKQGDTTLLDEEKAVVEVWSYEDGRLYTQQNVRLEREKKKSYTSVYHIDSQELFNIGDEKINYTSVSDEGNGIIALGLDASPYLLDISWKGSPRNDVYLIDASTGKSKMIAKAVSGSVKQSPQGKYFYWYSRPDSTLVLYNTASRKTISLPGENNFIIYNERNDVPADANWYGSAGWTTNDEYLIVNDHYDLWKVRASNGSKEKLTDGRKSHTRYRYVRLDRDEKNIDLRKKLLLYTFNEKSKKSGYAYLLNGKVSTIVEEDLMYDFSVTKAKDSDDIIYTKESYDIFPDLIHDNLTFRNSKKISTANPQQYDYEWGSIESIEWSSYDGDEMEGMLVKPNDFDPTKKYPLIVNFYERSSDRLHRHRAPFAHRSTINYTYYASRGYVIFNPDVTYHVGYPGKSCYEDVMSGIEKVKSLGYIDEDRIGVQGHSWGGYQIAHLLTKTDVFACAESGAPVVNMVSAYGGIRWGSGMSRMFQYEKTQSRLGATLWERPDLYLENSPIFNVDKITTPVLILHNDKDGAVPWYQGIEFFVALRRLGKPSWLLNYNDEPHWPVKWPNRLDFNIRMQQFFDHYLMGDPLPNWMNKGVPATMKGIDDGLGKTR